MKTTHLFRFIQNRKSITKATSEEKITAKRELDITTQRDYKNTTPEMTAKLQKKSPKKRKFKVPFAKKEEQKYSDQIPHRREFPSQAEMVDATGQKNSIRDSSVPVSYTHLTLPTIYSV